jgi:hypothetical protein
MGTVRRVSRNVKYWRSPSMALRWAGAAMQEAAKGFRRPQGLQAASTSPGSARRSQGKSHFIERASCPNHEGCVGSQSVTPASRFSTSSGTSPFSLQHHLNSPITLRLERIVGRLNLKGERRNCEALSSRRPTSAP